ncbi:hypothetical protein BDV18DRAFT_162956 [Aspergillus unguis]
MPMVWTPEANNKVFLPENHRSQDHPTDLANLQILLGILQQHQERNFKIDYAQLTKYMGPECTKRSLENQISKLKKQAGSAEGNLTQENGATDPATPTATPKVTPRHRRAPSRGTPSKKNKFKDVDADKDGDETEDDAAEVKAELEDLN